ncbi:LacI family DNA-binding transcriptional regulator [Litorihabitans aurantiacus]|uniref:LacI family transcriptional regulator n=1 Tax=Litorihabitans aurantiacus TaxID=1930061 RepID=A0AA37XHE1_9MICO|nr:LacI family DNA-binding transcriptional regulator [Litorihabitans aurantiacus]GMA33149.1 LacI family transcriptional regulator [Litorihabitans aurantiacus]
MARVRLVDVAERVGVSTKTVSNVVNGTGWVGDAVRARVLAAIDDLGYRPNLAARQLRSGSSGLLGLCIPNLQEPYFAELASQLVSTAQLRGLTVLLTQSKGSRAVELDVLEGANLPALDGLVLSPLAVTAQDVAERRSTAPLVLIGEHGEGLASDTVCHVGPDNAAAARDATQHLLAAGRRRIAAIGLQSRVADTAVLRFEGYRRALAEAGIDVDPALTVEVERYNRAEGSHAIEELISRGVEFDGVFCFTDSLAFGALHTLGMHGIRVPDDVMLVGYDNIDESRFTVPPLTSVDSGVARASALILDVIAGRHAVPPGGRIVVPHELAVR